MSYTSGNKAPTLMAQAPNRVGNKSKDPAKLTGGVTAVTRPSGGTAYSDVGLNGDGSAGSYTLNTNSAYNRLNFSMIDSGYTANIFSNAELYIPSYTVSQNKPLSSFQVTENDATAVMQVNANLWSSTSTISSVTLTTNAGNFIANSSFYLYGIKNS